MLIGMDITLRYGKKTSLWGKTRVNRVRSAVIVLVDIFSLPGHATTSTTIRSITSQLPTQALPSIAVEKKLKIYKERNIAT